MGDPTPDRSEAIGIDLEHVVKIASKQRKRNSLTYYYRCMIMVHMYMRSHVLWRQVEWNVNMLAGRFRLALPRL